MSKAVEDNRREDLRHQLRFYFTLVKKDADQKEHNCNRLEDVGVCMACHGKTAKGNNLCSTCVEFVVERLTD